MKNLLFLVLLVGVMAFVGVDAARSYRAGEMLRAGLEFLGVLLGGAILGLRLRA